MDKLQQDILALLQEDARFSTEKLAQMTNSDESTVANAILEMESNGTLVGYSAIVNNENFDDDVVEALIEVKVTPEKYKGFDAIAEEIQDFEEVKGLYLMSGGYDLTVMVVGKTLKDVAMFVSQKLSTIDNVISTTTHFILKKYKIEGKLVHNQIDTREVVNP